MPNNIPTLARSSFKDLIKYRLGLIGVLCGIKAPSRLDTAYQGGDGKHVLGEVYFGLYQNEEGLVTLWKW